MEIEPMGIEPMGIEPVGFDSPGVPHTFYFTPSGVRNSRVPLYVTLQIQAILTVGLFRRSSVLKRQTLRFRDLASIKRKCSLLWL